MVSSVYTERDSRAGFFDSWFYAKRLLLIVAKSTPYDSKLVKEVRSAFRGLFNFKDLGPKQPLFFDFYQNIYARYLDVLSFEPTEQERGQIQRLIEHRKRMWRYAEMMERKDLVNRIIQTIWSDIERLSSLPFDQRRSFCIPGGSSDHAVCYEFCLEKDGTYTFLLYNKGSGAKTQPQMHGTVVLHKNGRECLRSRIQIRELAKKDIQDARFLRQLIEVYQREGSRIEEIYKLLQQTLLYTERDSRTGFSTNSSCFRYGPKPILESRSVYSGRGKIRCTPEEKLWIESRSWLSEEQLQAIEAQLLKDSDFHSAQIWETCTESNLQTPEHFIVDAQLRKKIKLHAIQRAFSASQLRFSEDSLFLQRVEEKKQKLLQSMKV